METIAETGATSMATARDTRDAEFTEYLLARQPALLRTAYLLTGDRASAEDLLQTSLAKLYLAWDRVNRRESVDGYLRRIMLNEHHSLWRRAWRRREVPVERIPETRPVTDEHDEGRHAELWSFVRTLPRRQRAVIVLRYYEELSEAETAAVLGCSVGTVKSQSSRALAALRTRAPRSLDPREEER